MRIVAQYEVDGVGKGRDPDELSSAAGETWRLMICPACNEVNVGLMRWYDHIEISDEFQMKIIYPAQNRSLNGLPPNIDRAYEIALKVRSIDSNAFAVLLGRVLDMVCLDKQATGKNLYEKLNCLVQRGDVPTRLGDIAHHLRELRNIGAHANLGELSPSEVPVLARLCQAILEYVYIAPQLLEEAEKTLQQLRQKPPDG